VSFLIRNAEVGGQPADVAIRDGRITAVGRPGTVPPTGDDIDARGGALLPGLHDHHIHLLALAAFRQSVLLGPPEVRTEVAFRQVLSRAATAVSGRWLRGVGYHESVAGRLDRDTLDLIVPDGPVRIQHRSGAMWIVNSAGIDHLGIDDVDRPGVERDSRGRPTGRIYGLDEWLRAQVTSDRPDLSPIGRELLAYGITGVTDTTPTERSEDVDLLAAAVESGALPQRVHVTGGLGLDPVAGAGLRRGPVKLVVADHDLPTPDELAGAIAAGHAIGRAVAIHAVTRVGLVLALAAWRDAGFMAGDRVEHGAVVPPEHAAELAALGITVITQPVFVADRGDQYLDEVDRDDLPHLWPYRSLLAAGVGVAPSSDAPFGDPDPWRGIAAAAGRRTLGGRSLGAGEAVDALTALNGYLTPLPAPAGPPRQVTPGAAADLVLLRVPLREALAEPSAALVAMTFREGRLPPHSSGQLPGGP
jgi:predicted amidohydrolase YtcJ